MLPTLDKRPSGPTVGQPPEGQMRSGQDLQAEQTAIKCPQFGFKQLMIELKAENILRVT